MITKKLFHMTNGGKTTSVLRSNSLGVNLYKLLVPLILRKSFILIEINNDYLIPYKPSI